MYNNILVHYTFLQIDLISPILAWKIWIHQLLRLALGIYLALIVCLLIISKNGPSPTESSSALQKPFSSIS